MKETVFDPTSAEIIDQMRNIPALSPLGDALIAKVVQMSKLRRYVADEVIINEGDNDAWLYFLVLGELVVMHQGVHVHQLRNFGEMFGEMGLIDGSPRSATVRAITPTVCLALDASLFASMEPADRAALKIAFNEIIVANLAERLRQTNKRLVGCEVPG